MNRLRIFTIISTFTFSTAAFACWEPQIKSVDNMIYRLYEDVSPYYRYIDEHVSYQSKGDDTESANLSLWRKQTQTSISDEDLKWYVYKSSLKELTAKSVDAISIFGEDGYRLLTIAKECEQFRNYINDPWYYPYKGDTLVLNTEKLLAETTNYQGKYASRYVLQTLRIYISLMKHREAVEYWEKQGKCLPEDVIKRMAERHAARAYLFTGDTLTAANVYAKYGDMASLAMCGLDKNEIWKIVYAQCPDSPFFKTELQYLLTHLDNRYLENLKDESGYYLKVLNSHEQHINTVLDIADKAITDGQVKDVAMWYYAKAALQNIIGQEDKALATVKEGEKHCTPGTFIASSMRVLRIMIEAETSTYDDKYQARLVRDLKWLDMMGQKNLTSSVKDLFKVEPALDFEGNPLGFNYDVCFVNSYYWNDVIERILVDVLVPRLIASGKTSDALLYANLGVFWIMKNVYGKADSPNDCGIYTITNLQNAMTEITDTCQISDIITSYQHIANPTRGIDSLVVRYGKADKSYWCDMIGTHYIADHQYDKAVTWLKQVSREYQRSISSWDYYDRDPFCMKIGWSSRKRQHLNDKYDYKLNFAQEMIRLQRVMKNGSTADKRGEAMIRYGVGLNNQTEWCWALSRHGDSFDNNYSSERFMEKYDADLNESQEMIDKGIETLEDRELKAQYLHLFVRNKEVMQKYSDTKTAQSLRAHCDLWRDYAKK